MFYHEFWYRFLFTVFLSLVQGLDVVSQTGTFSAPPWLVLWRRRYIFDLFKFMLVNSHISDMISPSNLDLKIVVKVLQYLGITRPYSFWKLKMIIFTDQTSPWNTIILNLVAASVEVLVYALKRNACFVIYLYVLHIYTLIVTVALQTVVLKQ